jgi:hypothetical protein
VTSVTLTLGRRELLHTFPRRQVFDASPPVAGPSAAISTGRVLFACAEHLLPSPPHLAACEYVLLPLQLLFRKKPAVARLQVVEAPTAVVIRTNWEDIFAPLPQIHLRRRVQANIQYATVRATSENGQNTTERHTS